MAKIKEEKPKVSPWPWGSQAVVKERLVEPIQLLKGKSQQKPGDAKNPPLASFALLESIAPGHSTDELRLPRPQIPSTLGGEVQGFVDLQLLRSAMQRSGEDRVRDTERQLQSLRATKERVDRLKSLLQREGQMMKLVQRVYAEKDEIRKRREEEQAKEGY